MFRRIRGSVGPGLVLYLLSGCSGVAPEASTIRSSERAILYEGLPHPMYEASALAAERKAKPTIELHGFSFYRETLSWNAGDDEKLKSLLGDSRSFQPFSAEKKCGGFHPDYAVEWTVAGQPHFCLICLGCWEVRIFGPKGGETYDIRHEARNRLKDLLGPYRKNRPPFQPAQPVDSVESNPGA